MSKKQQAVKKFTPSIRFYLTIGLLLIILGGLLGYQPLSQYWHERNISTENSNPPAQNDQLQTGTKNIQPIQGKPVRIEVPSLGINLSVVDGLYNPVSKSWTLSNNKAHFALMTTMPNNKMGNTFIYGHNRREVFSRLNKLAVGGKVSVYTDNGHVFTYHYRSSYETDPNDDSLFDYEGPPILTLQTCSGLWYQNRFLMTLDLVEVI